jgi:transglycosylase-like protein
LLTKRTYLIPFLMLLVAFPAVALAATDDDPRRRGALGDPRIGLADARQVDQGTNPVDPARQAWHVASFHREVQAGVRRLRAARRAKLRRGRRERQEEFASLPGGVSMATLESIASCESGGNPTAVSSDGSYRGKYQFSYETWAAIGGSGDPAAASESEQDYRAALLYAQSGSSPWPVCG